MAIVLRITLDGSHQFYDITKLKGPLTFGRDEGCDYQLKNDGCSGEHISLIFKNSYISIKDLRSKNGTFLNSKRIDHGKLYLDDIIQIGEVYIEIHTDSLSVTERKNLRNQDKLNNNRAGDLTIPDVMSSQRDPDKLVRNEKKRHGFDELTNITTSIITRITKFIKKK